MLSDHSCRAQSAAFTLRLGILEDFLRYTCIHKCLAGEKGPVNPQGSTLHDNGIYLAPPDVVAAAFELEIEPPAAYAQPPGSAHPAQDVWALAVIAFESLTGRPALDNEGAACRCARGEQPYPWERPPGEQAQEWREAESLRAVLEPCLARDAAARPSADALRRELAQQCEELLSASDTMSEDRTQATA